MSNAHTVVKSALFLAMLALETKGVVQANVLDDPAIRERKANVELAIRGLSQFFSAGDLVSLKMDAQTKNPLEMIQAYLLAAYPGTGNFTRVINNPTNGIIIDDWMAGMMLPQSAIDEFSTQVRVYSDQELRLSQRRIDERVQAAKGQMKALSEKKGIIFGSDGFARNSCQDITLKMLVLDTETEILYALDLQPCRFEQNMAGALPVGPSAEVFQ